MKLNEYLMQARSLIADGWVQQCSRIEIAPGKFVYCMIGAVIEASHAMDYGSTLETLRAALSKTTGWGPSLTEFNDAPGRTQAEVLAIFDHAIAHALADELIAAAKNNPQNVIDYVSEYEPKEV